MNETMNNHYGWSNIGIWGFVIFLLILFGWLYSSFNNGEHRRDGHDTYAATCANEKATIAQTATTQFKVIEQAELTRDTILASNRQTQEKVDFYAYQDLRDKLAESQREVMSLQNQLFVKDQLAPITAQLSDIRCNMLPRPQVTGVGAVCPNAGIINGLGVSSTFNNGCGYGCGTL